VAGREISVKKYVVKLSAEERERLEAMICAGKDPAQSLTKARILLKGGRVGGGRRLERQRDLGGVEHQHLSQIRQLALIVAHGAAAFQSAVASRWT
jgi:hypothetical protein